MAPSPAKFLKDGHGLHLSSPPASNKHTVYTMDSDSQLLPSEDLHKMLLSFLSSLQPNSPDLPSNAGVTTGQPKSITLPSPDCLAPSYNSVADSQQSPPILPGVSHSCVLPEHNGRGGCLKTAGQCWPGANDTPLSHSLSNLSPVSLTFANADYNSVLAPIVSNQESYRFDQLLPLFNLLNQINNRALMQTDPHSQAQKLRKRLQDLLGQHALLHCDQKLGRPRTSADMGGFSAGAELSPAESEQPFTWLETSPHFTEIKEFSQCSHAVFKGQQEARDSEATASSSSDDEPVQTKMPVEYREATVEAPCFEKQWLKERAELCSRWSWLQLRVAELEGRILKCTELDENICSAKGCVVLGNSQEMAHLQMKNALLREMAEFSDTLRDADNEPCSPSRLLHNIERQSAELREFVKSLMPSLNLSTLSKPSQPWGDKRAFNSDGFVSGSWKWRKFCERRPLFKDVCARTRPLVNYHKHRLFKLTISNNNSLGCSSPSSDKDCSSNAMLSSRTFSSNSEDPTSVFNRFTKVSAREEWSQIPLVINDLPSSPVHNRRQSSTSLYKSHKPRRHNTKKLGLSPIRRHDCRQRKQRQVHQMKRKRRRRGKVTQDEDDEDACWENSSNNILEKDYVLSTRGAVQRRHGESVFNINNIVLPTYLTKEEKLQYKDILTPSWQMADIEALMKNEADLEKGKEEQIEIQTDEVFAQRHLPLEQKEKLRWSLWKRHSSRSGNRPSSCDGVLEENPVEWSFTQLDSEEQLSAEECLPQAPWKHRVFPLNEDDERALFSSPTAV